METPEETDPKAIRTGTEVSKGVISTPIPSPDSYTEIIKRGWRAWMRQP
ncbi:hypothetical protein ACSNOH_08590 [Streptomyces sp. URMC 127]